MPLLKTQGFPPGGWLFFQPQTNWNAPFPLSDTFDQTVDRIIEMRQRNPRFGLSTEWSKVAEELDRFTCLRLPNNPEWVENAEIKKKVHRPRSGMFRGVAEHVAGISKLAGGARIINEWLGAGGRPVSQELAQKRTNVCNQCPMNTHGGFVVSKITRSMAEAIKEQLRTKSELALSTAGEDKLGTCKVCLCHLPLAVWCPIEHIRSYTSQALLKEFPEWCWKRQELSA